MVPPTWILDMAASVPSTKAAPYTRAEPAYRVPVVSSVSAVIPARAVMALLNVAVPTTVMLDSTRRGAPLMMAPPWAARAPVMTALPPIWAPPAAIAREPNDALPSPVTLPAIETSAAAVRAPAT